MRLELEVQDVEDDTTPTDNGREPGLALTPGVLMKAMMPGFTVRQAVRKLVGNDPYDSSGDDELAPLICRAELIACRKDFRVKLKLRREDWLAQNVDHPLIKRPVRLVLLTELHSMAVEKKDYSNAIRAVVEARKEAAEETAEDTSGSVLEKLIPRLSESLDQVSDPAERVRLIRDFIIKEGEERG